MQGHLLLERLTPFDRVCLALGMRLVGSRTWRIRSCSPAGAAGYRTAALRGMEIAIKVARGETIGYLFAAVLDQKGVQQCMTWTPMLPHLDLEWVLGAMFSFELTESVDLKGLSRNLGSRISEDNLPSGNDLSYEDRGATCPVCSSGVLASFFPEMVWCPNPTFLPQVLSDSNLDQVFELRLLFSAQGDSGSDQWATLCPVRAHSAFLKCTETSCKTDQLLSVSKRNVQGNHYRRRGCLVSCGNDPADL